MEAAEERGRLQEAMQTAEQEHAQAIWSMRAALGRTLQEMVDSEEATLAEQSAAMERARLTAPPSCIRPWALRPVSSCVHAW